MGSNGTTGRQLKTTANSLQVVHALFELDGARVAELADHLDMADSTVHAHLSTLREHGYVTQEGDSYEIGLKFLELGNYARQRKKVDQMAENVVKELAEETGELVQYLVEEQGRGIFTYREEGGQSVHTVTEIGRRHPLHQLAAGKAVLAHLPPSRTDQIIEHQGLPTSTEQTITDRDALEEDLESVREHGYAINDEEFMSGVRAIGVPVTLPSGQVAGAFGVAGPAYRMSEERFKQEIPNLMLGTVNELEINIEYS